MGMAEVQESSENRDLRRASGPSCDAEGGADGDHGAPPLAPASDCSGLGDDAQDATNEHGEGSRAKKKRRTPGVKVPRWSIEEEDKLRSLVERHGTKDWARIAAELGSHRSPSGVDQHWQILSGKRRRNGKAANTASQAMVTAGAAISSTDGDALGDVPVFVASVAHPTPSNLPKRDRRSTGKVARWTPEEEDHLRALVGGIGEPDWEAVAQELGTGRTGTGVDQHYQIMTGKRKIYYVSAAEKRAVTDNSLRAPIAIATLQTDAPTNPPGECSAT